MADAGTGGTGVFGGSAGAPAAPAPKFTLIADGGIALFSDGAMIYVLFSARPCPKGSTLTYESFGKAFLASYCQRCHSATQMGSDRHDAPPGINFDDQPTVASLAARIWGQAGDSNTTMPAGAPFPTLEERARLGEWLACGAPGGTALPVADAGKP
jgi:hypothetical protein